MNIFSFFSEMAFTVSTLSYSFGQVSVIVAFKLSISADSTTLEFTIGNGRFSVTAMMGHIMANAMDAGSIYPIEEGAISLEKRTIIMTFRGTTISLTASTLKIPKLKLPNVLAAMDYVLPERASSAYTKQEIPVVLQGGNKHQQ